MKILLAIDGSPCSEAAINEVFQRTWPTGSEVRVISVCEIPVAPAMAPFAIPSTYYDEVQKATRENTAKIVRAAVSMLQNSPQKSLEISGETMEGSPKRAILDEAERWGADLIIVGSHGYGVLDRLLLGSVSQGVALHAKCSVEIVRSADLCGK